MDCLIEIRIKSQTLSSNSVLSLCKALENNTHVTHLILNSNNFENVETIAQIANLFLKNTTIEVLDLSNNKIDDECVYQFIDVLETSKLKALVLDNNSIKDANV